jgi:hypothetical protein
MVKKHKKDSRKRLASKHFKKPYTAHRKADGLAIILSTGERKATVRFFVLLSRQENICMENCVREKPSAARRWPT